VLVLTRKDGESILIGNDIEVVVGRIVRNKVRIAVRAPRDVLIIRKEIARKGDENAGNHDS